MRQAQRDEVADAAEPESSGAGARQGAAAEAPLDERAAAEAPLEERAAAKGESAIAVRSRCFSFGITEHQLVVTIAWGSFDEAEAQRLGEVWRRTFDGPPCDTLVDCTHLVMSDAGAFTSLRDLLERHREDRARVVKRQAIVMREDWSGVFVSGYLALYPPPYEMRAFSDRGAALDWLGHRASQAEIEELDSARIDVLARLREWLEAARLEEATIERAVGELGITSRTLQRRLLEAGTRFTAELARAQVSRAQRLMLEPSKKLSEIALEVGCASSSTFSDLFRRVTGETPSQWRKRHS